METPRLTSLHIENFKSLKDVKLWGLPPLVVLIGENGSGKSSVLEGVVRLNDDKNFLSKINSALIPADSESTTATHLSISGNNLPSVCYYLQEKHPLVWEEINRTLRQFIPGIHQAFVIAIPNSRVVYLHFKNEKNESVFLPREMSDGTLLMLAHLVLLRHPEPHPVLCIDEPEHHLYPKFLPVLAEEIKAYAERAGTVFMATHSPDLINNFPLSSIYFCRKNADNVTEIHRLSENSYLNTLYEIEGYLPGDLLRDSVIDAQFK